jgi:hypothetical protein
VALGALWRWRLEAKGFLFGLVYPTNEVVQIEGKIRRGVVGLVSDDFPI